MFWPFWYPFWPFTREGKGLRLRRARFEDVPAMARIHEQGFSAGWDQQSLESLLSAPQNFCIVALHEEIAGFILLQQVEEEAEILTIAVDPRKRRSGVGKALLEAALGELQSNGAKSLFLEVNVNNLAATKLYLSHDFVEVGRRKGYYHERAGLEDAVVMKLAFLKIWPRVWLDGRA